MGNLFSCTKSDSYTISPNSDQKTSLPETGEKPAEENQPKYKTAENQDRDEEEAKIEAKLEFEETANLKTYLLKTLFQEHVTNIAKGEC